MAVYKVRDLIAAIEPLGWVHVRTKGSHHTYRKQGVRDVITLPGQPGDDITPGVLAKTCRIAGLDKQTLTQHEHDL